jgi:uncharacterized protein
MPRRTPGTLRRVGSHLSALAFEWDSALIVADSRRAYGESRFQAFGLIAGRLHVLVFTTRSGKTHIISLRKANKREVKRYEAQAQP